MLAALVPVVVNASPAAATVAPDSSHPYSNPVWYPLRDVAQSDCEKSNPGCTHLGPGGTAYHGYWAMDIDEVKPFPSNDPVYPMGAGILHVTQSSEACPSGHRGAGASVWIDHGNGVRSIYAHLHSVVTSLDGHYVTPTTRIAYVGTTDTGNCNHATFKYLYVAVKHGSSYVEIPRLYACRNGQKQSWPQALGYTSWNTIPMHTALPASDSTCITKAATPNRPAAPRAYRVSTGKVHYLWTTPSNVVHTVVEIEEWHPSLNKYTPDRKVTVTGSSVYVSGMQSGRKYIARLWFYNYGGYSAPSAWTLKIPS